MKSKKVFLFLLIFSLTFFIVACSNETNQTEDSDDISTNSESAETSDEVADGGGEPKQGGTLKVALTGEPPTLDNHLSTADLAGKVSWHIFEGLFTLDENYSPIPMLAKDYEYDESTKTYIINLREGVKFHNGSEMTADDVVASINRWGEVSNYGAIMFENVKDVSKEGDYTVIIELLEDSAVVPILLAYPNQQSAIYPKDVIDKYGDNPIEEFIGTGPFKFVEHKPEQYIKVERFDDYVALDEPANGMGGNRTAYVDSIEFIPTPETSVRYDGVQTGQFHWADSVSTDMYELMETNDQVEAGIVKPYWWPMIVFNKEKGLFADKKARQAFALALDMESIMKGAFAYDDFYRLDPSVMFQEQEEFWSDAGKEMYNQADIERAKQLLDETDYNGEALRWITTREYDYMYNIAVIASEQLKEIGFNFEMEVVDYATIVDRRANPDEYELFSGATTFTPDPGVWPVWEETWPGFWKGEEKDEMLKAVNSEMDPDKRKEKYGELHALFWEEVPVLKTGDYFILTAKDPSMKGFNDSPFPYFWNTWIE